MRAQPREIPVRRRARGRGLPAPAGRHGATLAALAGDASGLADRLRALALRLPGPPRGQLECLLVDHAEPLRAGLVALALTTEAPP